jgi:hypothetical protein
MLPLGGQRGDYVGESLAWPRKETRVYATAPGAEKYHLNKRAHHAGQQLHDLRVSCDKRQLWGSSGKGLGSLMFSWARDYL